MDNPSIVNKVCPVVLRSVGGKYEILAFNHPLAGKQIVKGTIEANEPPEEAAIRELKEESGLKGVVYKNLGVWESGYNHQVWDVYLMLVEGSIPNNFSFYTQDDGGHYFEYFWQPLERRLDEQWHSLFSGAISFIKNSMAK